MKKLILMAALFAAFGSIEASAQAAAAQAAGAQGGDQAAMAQRMKERMRPGLVAKAHLTEEQADKVLDVNIALREEMRGLNDEERKKKIEGMEAERNKRYKAIPLTDEQVKAVNDYYEEMRRNRPQGQRPGGN